MPAVFLKKKDIKHALYLPCKMIVMYFNCHSQRYFLFSIDTMGKFLKEIGILYRTLLDNKYKTRALFTYKCTMALFLLADIQHQK